MRIGCLQFAPQVGDVDNNIERADAILNQANPEQLDLLVLPELAFTGYNFKSLREISPHLEPTGAGITSVWALTTALKYNCKVVVGYPETADVSQRWPASVEYYNSAIIVNEDGDTCGHYRKSHLYYTDESWALEGTGFFNDPIDGIGQVALGICMDLNPYKFEAPWNAYEFAFHVLDVAANVVILSMAWLTREDAAVFGRQPREPDMETLTYWITRLEPLIRAETEEEIIVVFANRTGVEDDAVYAGTSAVLGIQNGEVTVYGLLGRGEKKLLVVDTEKPGIAKLVYRPDGDTSETTEASGSEPHISPGPDNNDTRSDSPGALSEPPSHSEHQPDNEGSSLNNDRSSSCHLFIDSATTPLPNTRVLTSTDIESPVSPRYLCHEPQLESLMSHQYPKLQIHDSQGEWHSSPNPGQHSTHRHLIAEDSEFRADNNEAKGSPYLVNGSENQKVTEYTPRVQQTLAESHDAGASNWGFTGGGGRIDEPDGGVRRTTSPDRRHRHRLSSTDHQYLPRHAPKSSRNADTNGDIHRNAGRRTSPLRNDALTPTLEKLGADLMVFEGERASRPKRDSLICHVDEDDYIVLRRDTVSKRQQQTLDEQISRNTSRDKAQPQQALYQNDVGSPPVSRTVAASSTRRMEAKEVNSVRSVVPKRVSKSDSHNRMASQVELPIVGSVRQSKDEAIYPSANYNAPLAGAPPPLTRACQADKHTCSKRAGREGRAEKYATLHTRATETSNKNDDQSLAVGSMSSAGVPIVFSVDAPNTTFSPSDASSGDVGMPKRGLAAVEGVWKGMPPTPKAMVLPPQYNDSDIGYQSARPRPKNQVSAIVV